MKKVFFAQKAFILDNDKLLMIQKSDKDIVNPNKWEVPGGKLEFGETIDEALLREVKEEVGIDIEIGEPFDIWQWQFSNGEDDIQIVAVARFCKAITKNLTSQYQVSSDNIAKMEWVSLDEVLNCEIISNARPTFEKYIKIKQMENNNETNF